MTAFDVKAPQETKPAESLRGVHVAFTGRLAAISRDEAHERLRGAGGIPTTTVSGQTGFLVIGMHGWPLRTDGTVSAKLQHAERLRARHGRIRIISEDRFLELLGMRRAEALRKTYEIEQVASLVGVEHQTIERWEYLGLVRSEGGRYDFQDIVSLQTIASLVKDGVHPQRIRESLASLASFVAGTERPFAQLNIVASDSGELTARIDDALIAPDGQQILEFESNDPSPQQQIESSTALEPRTADDFFQLALQLEEDEQMEEAAIAYRQAIRLQSDRSEAYFNLGNVLRMMGRPDGAEELYQLAVTFDPGDELAWYNLADVQEEASRVDEAITSLRQAIQIAPTFADGHFNLASCLEQAGDRDNAAEHWQRYLQLDPASEWAAIARKHLAGEPIR